jgi:hypothetical protein
LGLPLHKGPNPSNTRNPWVSNTINSLTPPTVKTLAIADVETGLKLWEHRGQPLSEDVGELKSRQDVEDTNIPDDNTLTDKVKINLNMLGALVLNEVGREVDGVDVVTVD